MLKTDNAHRSHVIDLLRRVPIFSQLGTRDLRRVAGMGDVAAVPAGKELTTQGETGDEFYLIVSGTAECWIDGELVREYSIGDFFGEMAMILATPRSATIRTTSDAELFVLGSRGFRRLLATERSIVPKMLRELAIRLRARDERNMHYVV